MLEILKRTHESRQVKINPLSASVRRCDDGTTYISCGPEIESSVSNITKKLDYWAAHAPDRTFLANENSDGAWRTITYFETLTRVRRIAQSLLRRNLSADRPVAILSGNSIEHALLALAACTSALFTRLSRLRTAWPLENTQLSIFCGAASSQNWYLPLRELDLSELF